MHRPAGHCRRQHHRPAAHAASARVRGGDHPLCASGLVCAHRLRVVWHRVFHPERRASGGPAADAGTKASVSLCRLPCDGHNQSLAYIAQRGRDDAVRGSGRGVSKVLLVTDKRIKALNRLLDIGGYLSQLQPKAML